MEVTCGLGDGASVCTGRTGAVSAFMAGDINPNTSSSFHIVSERTCLTGG
jgi:hypothetical protein